MKSLRQNPAGLVPLVGFLVFTLGLAWLIFSPRFLQSLPDNFSYQADIFSQDNLYDTQQGRYQGQQNSRTNFYYETVTQNNGHLQIRNVFDVKAESGEQIFKVERIYNIDKATGKHVDGGDQDREGYLFAPRNLKLNQGYSYWHVNYDRAIDMQYQSTEEILGLKVFRYNAKFQADQTDELSSLPGVPDKRGVRLDVELTTWIEPTTGSLIKYQDGGEAYFYDQKTGEKLHPWNKFSNRYAVADVGKQVSKTQSQINSEFIQTRAIGYIVTLAGLSVTAGWVLHRRRLGHLLVFVVFATGIGLTLVVFLVADNNLQSQRQRDYADRAQTVETSIINNLHSYENSLRGGVGLFASSETVSRQEWRAYIDTLDIRSHLPGLQGIGWAPRVASLTERTQIVKRVQAEGFADFTIWPKTVNPDFYPIIYLEPFDERNKKAFGYDMYQEISRRRAMDQAIETGQPALSNKITLVQENQTDKQNGFLLYLPLYQSGSNPLTEEERRQANTGFVYAPLRADDFIRNSLSEIGESLTFDLYDGTNDNASLLYASRGDKTKVYRESIITIFGSDWKIKYYTDPSSINTFGERNRLVALVTGLVLTLLFASIVHLLQRTGLRAERLAANMTKDLREREERANQAAAFSQLAERNLAESQKLLIEQNTALQDTKKATLNILEDLADEKEKLQTATARTEAMINSIGEGLIVADAKGTIVEVNPVAVSLLNSSRTKLIGEWYPNVVQLTDDKDQVVEQTERPEVRALLTGEPVEAKDYSLIRKEGVLPVAITASPYILDDHPIGTVIVVRDITKERELDQAKDDFLGLASHQLRTPATAVKQYVGLLLDGYTGKLTKEQMETLQAAHLSNERQIDVIQDMLSVARLESGRLDLNIARFDLVAMVKAAIEEQKLAIENRKQTLSVNLPNSLPVEADEKLLRMVVENLVSNASKYTPKKGSIEIRLSDNGELISLDVKDSGVGIAQKNIQSLFKRFSRIKNELSDVVGGSGLGLHIAQKIANLHGGKITVQSKLGKGATFTLTLLASNSKK